MPFDRAVRQFLKDNKDDDNLQHLSILIDEAKRRGIDVASVVKSKARVVKFPVNDNGYFNRSDKKVFVPNSEPQKNFILSNARFCALISGRGGGKTAAGSQKALRKIMEGYNGAILNPDFENFKTSTWAEFREWIPWNMVVPDHRRMRNPEWTPHQPFTIAFLNGVRIICKGLKDPDSARGPNINWLWYDEAGRDKTGMSWRLAIASVRVGNNPQAWITTTPAFDAPWIEDFFINQKIPEDVLKLYEEMDRSRKLIDVFEMSMMDNKANLDPGFIASMLAAYPSGYLREQEIYGRFVKPEGTLGNRTWFDGKIIPTLPLDEIIKKRVRFWDLAASEKKIGGRKREDPDETIGTLASYDGENIYIENQVGGCWEWDDIKRNIYSTAIEDGFLVEIYVEQEPASGGKNQIAELNDFIKKEIPGHPGIKGYRPEGDRVILANRWFSLASQGKIYLVRGEWNEKFLDQLTMFPQPNRHDDRITSVSGAIINLIPLMKKWKTVEFLSL